MRTTITFEEDVAAAVTRLQRQEGVGISEAVNRLIRAGLLRERHRVKFVQRTSAMKARIDVTNVAEALEVLEGPSAR